MRKIIFIISALSIFAFFNYSIFKKERIKMHGETVFLELSSKYPRYFQENSMGLIYAIEQDQNKKLSSNTTEREGSIVISVDQNKIGVFKRFYTGGNLEPNEKLFRYNKNIYLKIIPNSFLFQKGSGKIYENASYGVFKFDGQKDYILVGLADDKMHLIHP